MAAKKSANIILKLNYYSLASILMCVSIMFMGYRFINLGNAPFVNDEPLLQILTSQFLAGGPIPLVGLTGTQPIPYGPNAIWFFSLIRSIHNNLLTLLMFQTALITLSFVFLFDAVKGFTTRLHLALVAFIASTSPLLFFYSRMLWDNTFLILYASMLVWSVIKIQNSLIQNEHNLPHSKFLYVWAIASGLGFNTHLLFIPLIAVSGIFIGWEYRNFLHLNFGKILRSATIAGMMMLLIILPYIYFLSDYKSKSAQSNSFHLALDNLGTVISGFFAFLSPSEYLQYLFQTDVPEILGQHKQFINIINNAVVENVFILMFSLSLIGYLIKRRRYKTEFNIQSLQREKVLTFSLTTMAIYALFFACTGKFQHPHYFHFLWWAPLLILLVSLEEMCETSKIYHGLIIIFILLAIFNGSIIYQSTSYTVSNYGSRFFRYGTSLETQIKITKKICSAARSNNLSIAEVDITEVSIFAHSLLAIREIESECNGVKLDFNPNSEFKIVYSSAKTHSAHLQVLHRGILLQ